MKNHSYIEVVYISSNNKIVTNNIVFTKNLTLELVLNDLVENQYFQKNFYLKRFLDVMVK